MSSTPVLRKFTKCPYLEKNMESGYLATQYGLKTTVQEVVLTPLEMIVQVAIQEALVIVDKHLRYWSRTSAKVTPERLHAVKIVLGRLLEAIRYHIPFFTAHSRSGHPLTAFQGRVLPFVR